MFVVFVVIVHSRTMLCVIRGNVRLVSAMHMRCILDIERHLCVCNTMVHIQLHICRATHAGRNERHQRNCKQKQTDLFIYGRTQRDANSYSHLIVGRTITQKGYLLVRER